MQVNAEMAGCTYIINSQWLEEKFRPTISSKQDQLNSDQAPQDQVTETPKGKSLGSMLSYLHTYFLYIQLEL